MNFMKKLVIILIMALSVEPTIASSTGISGKDKTTTTVTATTENLNNTLQKGKNTLEANCVTNTKKDYENILLIILDAVESADFEELISEGDLPNFQKLIKDGSYVKIDTTDHRSDTFGGHVQLFTGYGPDVTKIAGNPDAGKHEISKGLTIFERYKKAYPSSNITYINDVLNVLPKWPLRNAVSSIDRYIYIGNIANWSKQAKKYFRGYKKPGRWAGVVSMLGVWMFEDVVKMNKNFLFAMRFEEATNWGYMYLGGSSGYRDALRLYDIYIGRIIRHLRYEYIGNKYKMTYEDNPNDIYKKTAIFIVSDHGYAKNARNHYNSPNTVLVSNIKGLPESGDMKSIAATILESVEIDVSSYTPPMGKSLTKNSKYDITLQAGKLIKTAIKSDNVRFLTSYSLVHLVDRKKPGSLLFRFEPKKIKSVTFLLGVNYDSRIKVYTSQDGIKYNLYNELDKDSIVPGKRKSLTVPIGVKELRYVKIELLNEKKGTNFEAALYMMKIIGYPCPK